MLKTNIKCWNQLLKKKKKIVLKKYIKYIFWMLKTNVAVYRSTSFHSHAFGQVCLFYFWKSSNHSFPFYHHVIHHHVYSFLVDWISLFKRSSCLAITFARSEKQQDWYTAPGDLQTLSTNSYVQKIVFVQHSYLRLRSFSLLFFVNIIPWCDGVRRWRILDIILQCKMQTGLLM